MEYQHIINQLPYSEPFLFVDEVLSVSDEDISGTYTFKKNLFFYEGHFKQPCNTWRNTYGMYGTDWTGMFGYLSVKG